MRNSHLTNGSQKNPKKQVTFGINHRNHERFLFQTECDSSDSCCCSSEESIKWKPLAHRLISPRVVFYLSIHRHVASCTTATLNFLLPKICPKIFTPLLVFTKSRK
ncbi:hypothetical protein Csa_009612 [Cucumis sativus]|uniref:Uncharacterized protein n=1 Tax=Cucumis sativus TaxID=3659 RepID=A0A0A0L1L1_CUCSA|nr:hypothetical protein Csa_009612 [Cucumis sativus]